MQVEDQNQPALLSTGRQQTAAGPYDSKITWFALYGFLLLSLALAGYVTGVLLGPVRWLFWDPALFRRINEQIVWYSGIPLVAGIVLVCWDLFLNVQPLRRLKSIRHDPPRNDRLTVVLTAYNDERSIAGAVRDFRAHPLVQRVIVISNNSKDRTMELARQSGATVFNEERQGYGACVHRALREALLFDDTELTVLCEGDLTFRAYDLEKFLAYMPHADIVNGSRIVEQLQDRDTQLSMYMHYGNLFAGKVLELKHLGRVSLTDVGTTYKMCRNSALRQLMGRLDPRVNLEFNAYFLDSALKMGLRILECPISFHPRVGASKGGNVNNRVATRLGLRMLLGIFIDWRGFANG
ncbi:MAG TPA: glycosyltransferase family 2 protein [Candidatus Sulfotelmatobacter sp.]|nr:glycosyltransferase family 2 protein [Candidatus Sulfotelmatobacter sp.]